MRKPQTDQKDGTECSLKRERRGLSWTGCASGRKWNTALAFTVCAVFLLLNNSLTADAAMEHVEIISGGGSRKSEIPDRLLEFMEKYPEAADYVLAYPEKKDIHEPIDISGEVTKGEIPLFIQWDERWGYETYGSSFLGITGCGPTCLSMVYCGLTGDTQWNPFKMAVMAEDSGYYVWGAGSSWDLMQTGAENLGLTVRSLSLSASSIENALQSGRPVICSVGPGDFTYQGHFIVLTGTDGEGNISIADPNSPEKSGKTWEVETLVKQIKALWAYSFEE